MRVKPALHGQRKRGGWESTRSAWLIMVVFWLQVPNLVKVLEFKAHEGEIEDLALGPDGKVRR